MQFFTFEAATPGTGTGLLLLGEVMEALPLPWAGPDNQASERFV